MPCGVDSRRWLDAVPNRLTKGILCRSRHRGVQKSPWGSLQFRAALMRGQSERHISAGFRSCGWRHGASHLLIATLWLRPGRNRQARSYLEPRVCLRSRGMSPPPHYGWQMGPQWLFVPQLSCNGCSPNGSHLVLPQRVETVRPLLPPAQQP